MAQTIDPTPTDTNEIKVKGSYLDGLLPVLQRLDHLLQRAIKEAEKYLDKSSTLTDSFRGLFISHSDVEKLLAFEPGSSVLWPKNGATEDVTGDSGPYGSRLGWLAQTYGLSGFDVDVVLLALAPELDRRYEHLYAYLQDHVNHRRPSVDLALNLLCPDAATRLERRRHFDSQASLIHHKIIHLIPAPDQAHASLLAHAVMLDQQILRFLLGQDGLDSRLAGFCQVLDSNSIRGESALSFPVRQALSEVTLLAREAPWSLRLYFHGSEGTGRRHAAARLASDLGIPLLVVDLARLINSDIDFSNAIRLVFKYVELYDVILYLDFLDSLRGEEQDLKFQSLLDHLSKYEGVTIMAGRQAWVPSGRGTLGLISVSFSALSFTERRELWQAELTAAGMQLAEDVVDALADRFCLTSQQVVEAVTTATSNAYWQAAMDHASKDQVTYQKRRRPLGVTEQLFAAARAQSGHELEALSRKIESIYTWEDIVLPDDIIKQLHEICQRVAYRHRVFDEWGFRNKISLGKGVNALFSGASGTGKTMAADIVANELGLNLYKIDLSATVSKYIGETEKNLNRIFSAAENANAILFFDEADALFGKRSEVRDSHDRYANIEISYLLQKMEEYEGLSILATNLHKNMDEAFIRRLAFTVHFPFPDVTSRRLIWAGIWPSETPLAPEIDLDWLAHSFKLSGGNIKNVALAAAFLAAREGHPVTNANLLHAICREYQKMGRTLSDRELHYVHESELPARIST